MSAARAKKKPQEEFNLFDALKMLEKEKGIPVDYMIEKIQTAIAQAIKKDPFNSENSIVEIEPETGRFYVALRKDVVEEVEDPTTQISVEDAAKYQSGITAGSVLEVALDPKKFGRIAAQAAKSSIRVSGRPKRACCSRSMRAASTISFPPRCCGWIPSAAMSPWRSAAAKPCCPRPSRSPMRPLPRVSASRYMWWMCRTPKRAPAL